MSDVKGTVVEQPVEWCSVVVESDPKGASLDGRLEVQNALAFRGLDLSNIAHLKFWVPDASSAAELIETWLGEFPDPNHRPAVSVLSAELESGHAMDITVVATQNVSHRSVYENGAGESTFPSAVVRGDFLVVSTLSGEHPTTHAISDDPAEQASTVFGRLAGIIDQVGGTPNGIAHMFVWYGDHGVRETINGPFLEMFPFPGDRPCRHSVIRRLPPGQAMQVEVMGSISNRRHCFTIGGVWHGGIDAIPNSLPFGTKAGHFLFSAGTYGRNLTTGEIDLSIEEQTRYSILHTKAFLSATGSNTASIGHVFVWVRDACDIAYVRSELAAHLLGPETNGIVHVVQAELPGTNLVQLEVFLNHFH